MKVAFISDVHGNDVALQACLAAIGRMRIDRVHFLGDAVGYLPEEVPVLERLEAEGFPCQQGNHEAMLVGASGPDPARDAVYRLGPARARLAGTPHWSRICAWPTRIAREFGGRQFLLVHGSPSDELFGYVHADTSLDEFSDQVADVVIMANTHRPWIREARGRLFVNTGSIGLPRDHGSLAAFAVFDTKSGHCRIARVPIDVQEIARRYGTTIAPEVARCFDRRAERYVGEIVQ